MYCTYCLVDVSMCCAVDIIIPLLGSHFFFGSRSYMSVRLSSFSTRVNFEHPVSRPRWLAGYFHFNCDTIRFFFGFFIALGFVLRSQVRGVESRAAPRVRLP